MNDYRLTRRGHRVLVGLGVTIWLIVLLVMPPNGWRGLVSYVLLTLFILSVGDAIGWEVQRWRKQRRTP